MHSLFRLRSGHGIRIETTPEISARHPQRLAMLQVLAATAPDRIALGLSNEVLYLRLASHLQISSPNATVGFGMGNDSYRRLQDSPRYDCRRGLPWTAADQQARSDLSAHVVVVGRTTTCPGSRVVPDPLRRLSSSCVRAEVLQHAQSSPPSHRRLCLRGKVLPDVADLIKQYGLYTRACGDQDRGTGS